jgi:NAD(P)-dependent dehydrogenase (short-subunit alcohol dehydrogenase family)
MGDRVAGRRVAVTCAKDFMGPAITEVFREEGATVFADTRDLRPADAAAALIKDAGQVDILIVNLIAPDPRIILEQDTTEELWQVMFDTMVHPLYRLVHAVLPQMRERRAGKIVVMGSANALRGTNNRSAYSAARGAQVSYVRSVGLELAPHNVHINLMAQFFVENPTSVPGGKIADMASRLPEIPVGRFARGRESALFALYLAGPESDFFVGQTIPFSGGWVA